MSYDLYDYDRRYRRRAWGRAFRILLFLAVLGGIGLFCYQLGIEDRRAQLDRLREEQVELRERAEVLAQELETAQEQARAQQRQIANWQKRFETEVPRQELRPLMALIEQRLKDGVTLDRLSFVVGQASSSRDCQTAETKRFLVRTPLTNSANSYVAFANNTLTVSAMGESALDASGRPEAWFDQSKPLTLTITKIGGEEKVATGVLPLTQSVVIGAVEHRFSLIAGQRGFVQVTADRCRYP